MLIDGRNCAYRAAYAHVKSNGEGRTNTYHPFVHFIRQIAEIVGKFQPADVTCIWDAPRETIWRRKIFPMYKKRDDDNKYVEDLRPALRQIEAVAPHFLPHMGIREIRKATQETDDLIYSLCRVLYPKNTVIISSDRDFLQVPFRMPNVKLYEPQEKEFLQPPNYDPVVAKCLIGDNSDRIDGYIGIGKVKGAALAECNLKRQAFLAKDGPDLYYRNLILIDLAYNPDLIKNDVFVSAELANTPTFDRKAIDAAVREHKVNGLHQDFDRAVMPLKLYIGKKDKPNEVSTPV